MGHVVLVHGVRTSAAIWDAQIAALEAAGHTAVAVDLPGHGAHHRQRFTIDGALEVIHGATSASPVRPLLVGLSLGGYSSLACVARHPDAVAGLLLSGCSTQIRGLPVAGYRRLAAHVARTLRPQDTSWGVVTDMLHALQGYHALADLRRLRVPLWLVNGRWDPLRLGERRFVAAQPRARLTVVPGAGHDVNSHAPEAFNRVLLDAVAELAAAPGGARPAVAVAS